MGWRERERECGVKMNSVLFSRFLFCVVLGISSLAGHGREESFSRLHTENVSTGRLRKAIREELPHLIVICCPRFKGSCVIPIILSSF